MMNMYCAVLTSYYVPLLTEDICQLMLMFCLYLIRLVQLSASYRSCYNKSIENVDKNNGADLNSLYSL